MSQAMTKREATHPLAIRIALNGNLAGLKDEEIWQYYQQMCERLGLDPLSRPFDIIEGKEGETPKKVLYPNASCSAQLADKRGYSFGKVQIDAEQGLAALGMKVARVSVECTSREGRKLTGEAFIDLVGKYGPLIGTNLVNALKKAATQARRRATLQMAGLTLPSEDEHTPIASLGDIEQAIEDAFDADDQATPSLSPSFVAGALPATETHSQEEPRKGDSGRLKGKAAQIQALRERLGWSEEALLKVMDEEFGPSGPENTLADLLSDMPDADMATLIQLLKAEVQQKANRR
jgi:hypothetical protein